ncbi:DUF927 domain-containing protein [Pseudoflavonifractor sp. 524-17]|uniref:DUF927 domain-containing protein n=1 Tax=Pseudoflavonifractor sp. 524-17 TaxID=2304577 RepID=UPI00137AFE08|nr:DUF927 domain-containing protein [Pseudoflavonifractor sp. 524-17]NCE63315.1 DUF927 domain-containing protein [Pseudoflavonifractor sp. 524-17]
MIMEDRSKALQKEGQEMSPVFSESQSPETIEQKETTPKSSGTCTCKMDTIQDCDSSSVQQMRSPVEIDSITILDGELPVITLRIQSLLLEGIKYAKVCYADLTPKTLKNCVTKNGGAPTDWNDLLNVLMQDIKTCIEHNLFEVMYGHTKLGWIERTDGLAFCCQNIISSDNESSEYMGKLDIRPKGTLDNIVRIIKSQILSTSEWSPLEAIIAFSVASIVLPFAKDVWGKSMNNMILHLVGNSTSGKSTSLRLHAGLASNPFNEKSGLWLNHQSSLAALIRRIGHNQGFPVSIDELSSGSKKEYTDFVYAIGNGEEKDRLKAGGTALCDSANFSTIVLSSGEISILKKCSANAGIRARCVEFRNVKWTDSKEQADAIYDCLRDNYGCVAPLVAQELLNNSNRWKTRWDQIQDKIKKQMDEEKIRLAVGQRISEFVALFTLAAEIANEVVGINLNVDEICKFCYLHVITVNADEVNLGERAREYLLRYVAEHPDDFLGEERCITQFNTYYITKQTKGFTRRANKKRIINGKEYRWQIVFWCNCFEEILENGGFSPVVVAHELRDAHFLQVKDNHRCTCEVLLEKGPMKCYVLYCNHEDEMIYETMQFGKYDPFDEDDYEG